MLFVYNSYVILSSLYGWLDGWIDGWMEVRKEGKLERKNICLDLTFRWEEQREGFLQYFFFRILAKFVEIEQSANEININTNIFVYYVVQCVSDI